MTLQEKRLAEAIASIEVFPEFGFATCASTSDAGQVYIIDFDKWMYAKNCTCVGNRVYGLDCIHMHAFDRSQDEVRPSFHEQAGMTDMVVCYHAAHAKLIA